MVTGQEARTQIRGAVVRIVRSAAGVLLFASFVLGGCRVPTGDNHSAGESSEVIIFAAASLTEVFEEAVESLSKGGYSADVVFNFAGSQQLAGQLREGAPAGVFASADESRMQSAVDSGRVDPSNVRTFACNRLAVAYVRRGLRGGSRPAATAAPTLHTLAQPGRKIVVGSEAVPIGRYTRQFLANAALDEELGPRFRVGFEANIVSEEQNVRGVLSKLQLGEADAGVLYATDLAGSTRLQQIEIPTHLNVAATYTIAVVEDSPAARQAEAFIDFFFSAEGAALLHSHGFSTACRPDGPLLAGEQAASEADPHAYR